MDSEPPLTGLLFTSEFLYVINLLISAPLGLILLVLLLILSALISGAEVAFLSLSTRELEDLRSEKSRTAQRILRLRSGSRKFLATILIANNLVNVGIVILSAFLVAYLLPPETFRQWATSIIAFPLFGTVTALGMARVMSFVFTVLVVTFLLVLFGEVVPRVYAKLDSMRFARTMALPMQFLVGIFSPFSSILVGWTRFIERRLERRNNTLVSDAGIKEDIDKAIDLAIPGDANSRLEAGILKGIIKFNDVPVKQIMRSRVDIIALDTQISYTRLKEIVRNEGYSRMPVFKESLDNVLGMLYVKDLIGRMDLEDDFEWQTLVRPQVLYVPESKKINELLKEFQEEHVHMGIVIDEYGGTSGLVTLEDVMEEVIGEIKDEFDEAAEGDYRRIDQNTFLFDGKVLLNDVCRIIGIDSSNLEEARGDADSLAGLILEVSGKMPERGEEFSVAGISFTVISVTARRIEKIRVKLKQGT